MLAAPMILGLASAACAEKNETRRMKNVKLSSPISPDRGIRG